MGKTHQLGRKAANSENQIRAGLIIRLCAALRRASAQRDWQDWRSAIIRAAFSGQHQDYSDTGNPLHLLNGFVTARRAGVPVPEWVLQPLTVGIEMFLKSKGKITLDKALGFTVKSGERTRWNQAEQHEHDARLKWLFDQQLQNGLPLNSDAPGAQSAVEAVANILGYESAEKRGSLLQAYHKRLKKHSSRLSR